MCSAICSGPCLVFVKTRTTMISVSCNYGRVAPCRVQRPPFYGRIDSSRNVPERPFPFVRMSLGKSKPSDLPSFNARRHLVRLRTFPAHVNMFPYFYHLKTVCMPHYGITYYTPVLVSAPCEQSENEFPFIILRLHIAENIEHFSMK